MPSSGGLELAWRDEFSSAEEIFEGLAENSYRVRVGQMLPAVFRSSEKKPADAGERLAGAVSSMAAGDRLNGGRPAWRVCRPMA